MEFWGIFVFTPNSADFQKGCFFSKPVITREYQGQSNHPEHNSDIVLRLEHCPSAVGGAKRETFAKNRIFGAKYSQFPQCIVLNYLKNAKISIFWREFEETCYI